MVSPLTLRVTPPEETARNYAFLRREGIRHLERMAGGLWTGFNAHDPGITILEQLCYVTTDRPVGVLVAARRHEIDVIAEEGDEAESFTGINYMKVELDFVVN